MLVVGEASDGNAALIEIKDLQPDVVVMDISMPVLNGAKVTELLKRDCPQTKILVLTVHKDQGYVRQMLKAGASGYVLKRAATKELIKAIRAVAVGESYLDSAIANNVVGSYIRKQSAKDGISHGDLSERETDVLRLIALGYSNKEIASKIDVSTRTVETYKVRLMEKLNFHSRTEIVRYALLQGWLQDS